MIYTKEEILAAFANVGGTRDGAVIREFLAEKLMRGPTPGQKSGAVREEVGRLSMVREILSLLEGPRDSDAGEQQQPGTERTDRAARHTHRGAARRGRLG
ncbi:hypothetical protein [Pleomorphomonas sp. JP5]|uniref:hypothetical protein n=1 Tax=Pleomorphomonas sp. JP5 TaxID=2942998 RepID=UPI0020433B49|nr:hypothetical protein [Pleomorphomonas sp. JP5]MCM5558487.1 hypothetical protein [Pleomorphomonas sp. JP5]